jgi:thymidine phosphorylase
VRREPRLHAAVLALGAEMLVLGRLARTPAAARKRLEQALADGSAAERFGRMVKALGGPGDLLTRPWKHLERAPLEVPVPAPRAGTVGRIDTRQVGLAVVVLGGGRTRPTDPVDHAVGLTDLVAVGTPVAAGEPLARVHARSEAAAAQAVAMVQAAYRVGGRAAVAGPVVAERVTS